MSRALIRTEINAATLRFRYEEASVQALLRGPSGAVARDLTRRAIRVEALAKQNASQPPEFGPGSGSRPGGGPAVRTGRLRGSITFRLGEDALSLYADIGSAVLYAPYVEKGTSRMAARPFLRPALAAARI